MQLISRCKNAIDIALDSSWKYENGWMHRLPESVADLRLGYEVDDPSWIFYNSMSRVTGISHYQSLGQAILSRRDGPFPKLKNLTLEIRGGDIDSMRKSLEALKDVCISSNVRFAVIVPLPDQSIQEGMDCVRQLL